MCQKITCPCCGSRKIRKSTFASWQGFVGARIVNEWKCLTCGETCENPSKAGQTSHVLDVLVGLSVL